MSGFAPGAGTPVVAIVGWKNSGKTTMVERLVGIFTARGLNVATVKHAHHSFDLDQPGTDSDRHRAAGARQVALVSRRRTALMTELGDEPEPSLADMLSRLAPCDLIIVEGYKKERLPKIELRRGEGSKAAPISPGDADVVAIAADHPLEGETLPVFDMNQPERVADFILETIIRSGTRP